MSKANGTTKSGAPLLQGARRFPLQAGLCYNEEKQGEAHGMNGDALLFFDGKPEELALYEALEERIFSQIKNVRLKVGKSQISF